MKHELSVTLILIGIFAVSQIVGLYLVAESMQTVTCEEVGTCEATYEETALGGRPQTQGWGSLLYLGLGIGFGTAILLLLAKFKKTSIWRVWFFIAVWLTMAIALDVVLPGYWAWAIAFALAMWKLKRPNVIIYNIAEILMYAGMAVFLVPIFNAVWLGLVMLGLISVYDAYAVWKSKHMVQMAQFITGSNAFAGLVVPYRTDKKKVELRMPATQKDAKGTLSSKSKRRNAILGGGDMTFPLLFAGIVMQERVKELVGTGMSFASALQESYLVVLLISLGATLAIAGLFLLAKKDKFYPAMPFVSAGCLFGWALTFLF